MAKVYLDDTILTNIANSIRNKNGESTLYKPQEMSTAIDSIPSGGGSGDLETNLSLISYFYDKYPTVVEINNIMNEIKQNPYNLYDLYQMFRGATMMFNDPVVFNVDTKNILRCSSMFRYLSSYTSLDLTNFDVSNIWEMDYMFASSNVPGLITGVWNSKNVKKMNYIFSSSSFQELDLSSWVVSSACTDLSYAFSNASVLSSLNVSGWDTSNVTTLKNFCYLCSNLGQLDLSSWTIKATNVDSAFYGCSSLQTLKLGENFNPKVSSIGFFNTSTYQDIELTMGNNSDFSSNTGASTFILTKIWRGTDATKIARFETFANSLGTCTSAYTRTIQIYKNLYDVLTDEQKALITDKGYVLSYGT